MPPDTPEFPGPSHVHRHLVRFAEAHGLLAKIRLGVRVEALEKRNGRWFALPNGACAAAGYDRVVVATGACGAKAAPPEGISGFGGHVVHEAELWGDDGVCVRGRSVMVVGGGDAGSEAAEQLALRRSGAARVLVSVRGGRWFAERTLGAEAATDQWPSRAAMVCGHTASTSPLVRLLGLYFEGMWGTGGSGVPKWVPRARFAAAATTHSRGLVRLVQRRAVDARGPISRIEGRRVWTRGRGDPDIVDVLVLATGRQQASPRLGSPSDAFRYVFDVDDASRAYVGFARPEPFGSWTALAELQARWVARVWAGRCAPVPPPRERRARAKRDAHDHAAAWPVDHALRPTCVSPMQYSSEIAHRANVAPNLISEYLYAPRSVWWPIISGPWTPFQYRLSDSSSRPLSISRIQSSQPLNHPSSNTSKFIIFIHLLLVHIMLLLLFLLFLFIYLD